MIVKKTNHNWLEPKKPKNSDLFEFWGYSSGGLYVELNWKTEEHVEDCVILVEKSSNFLRWEILLNSNWLDVKNSEIINHGLKDLTPSLGKNFYRLTEKDSSGVIQYSEVIEVEFRGANIVSAIHDSSRELIVIHVNSTEYGKAIIRLISNCGNQELIENVIVQRGLNQFELKDNSIAKGEYKVLVSIEQRCLALARVII